MRCSAFFAITLYGIASFAAPAPVNVIRGSASVIERRHLGSQRDQFAVIRKVSHKYGWSLIDQTDVTPAARPASGGLPDSPPQPTAKQGGEAQGGFTPGEVSFLVPVTIGKQVLTMNVDTGSSDL